LFGPDEPFSPPRPRPCNFLRESDRQCLGQELRPELVERIAGTTLAAMRLNLGHVVALDESVTAQSIPPHTYDHCLETAETSPLEPDVLENKFYALDVGNVLTVDVDNGERSDLIEIRTGADGSARWTAVVRAALGRRRCR
jgi:hypothetical protein